MLSFSLQILLFWNINSADLRLYQMVSTCEISKMKQNLSVLIYKCIYFHFVLLAISSTILFLPLISLSPSLLFSMLIFSYLLLCLFQYPSFQLSVVLFCRKCFLFFYHLLDFSFFIAVLYVMIQHRCSILYSLFCTPYSYFHQYPCVCCTDW